MYFRSTWEANWARYLNWLMKHGEIRSWEFEPRTFQFEGIKRGSRFYTPDFRVVEPDGAHVWHEVKGYMDQRSQTKIDRFRRRFPGERLMVIDRHHYYDVRNRIAALIPHWESGR